MSLEKENVVVIILFDFSAVFKVEDARKEITFKISYDMKSSLCQKKVTADYTVTSRFINDSCRPSFSAVSTNKTMLHTN